MDDCLFFSIAVDTALFRNEDLLSCIARFSFDDKALEIPLFIVPCTVSSGKEMAVFLFQKLKERNVMFDKLVSVSTDGASNMVGKFNGMTKHFKELVEQHCRENNLVSPTIHTVWCFAHRINLLTKTFLKMKPVNVVLAFSDWFSNRRRQVAYKRFLAVEKKDDQLRAIPQPSMTRWLFYRDVVRAIISQAKCIEDFVSGDPEFLTFWNCLRSEQEKYGPCVQQDFSFSNGTIKATFDFTLFVLEMLGRVNTVFQESLCTTSQTWDIAVSLKRKIGQLLFQMSGNISCGLDSVDRLSRDEAKDFQTVLRLLLQNVEMRFPIPSTSLDMKCKQNSNTRQQHQGGDHYQRPFCSVQTVLEFISFPHNIIHSNELPTTLHHDMRREVLKISEEIMINQNRIKKVNQTRRKISTEALGFEIEMSTSLEDVFSVVDSKDYPLLWREYIKANTIIPTTVCCERSFSVIKQSTHTNMKTNTFIANATKKLHEKTIPKWF